jgi:triosephosphate isomerase
MSHGARPLAAGNWKMNGLRASLKEVAAICEAAAAGGAGQAEIVICPPATLLAEAAKICEGTPVKAGGQDCHAEPMGAFTGDISAEMLKDAGASYVILGHSERRLGHQESDASVRAKVKAAFRAGLTPIVCVGETLSQREEGQALEIVGSQLTGSIPEEPPAGEIVIAYEPVWAIGSGLTPRLDEIAAMHSFIRRRLKELFAAPSAGWRILYGGSVKPGNAGELLSVDEVDGALVGGACLSASTFMAIAGIYRA